VDALLPGPDHYVFETDETYFQKVNRAQEIHRFAVCHVYDGVQEDALILIAAGSLVDGRGETSPRQDVVAPRDVEVGLEADAERLVRTRLLRRAQCRQVYRHIDSKKRRDNHDDQENEDHVVERRDVDIGVLTHVVEIAAGKDRKFQLGWSAFLFIALAVDDAVVAICQDCAFQA
jgi:hypothetical protein